MSDVNPGRDGDKIGSVSDIRDERFGPTGPLEDGHRAASPTGTARRPVTAADIDAAARRIAGVATLTPLEECSRLSAETQTTVLLKREDLQVVRSYKLRGAFNLMSQLTAGERATGVVCASAGSAKG